MPPSALMEALQAIGRKLKLYGVALGAGRIVAMAVGLLLGIVFVDWAAHVTTIAPGGLPGPARLALMLAAIALLVYAMIRWIAQPALKEYAAGDVAGWIEERIPQFGDTLRSTVNFISNADVPGSRAMKQRVVSQAAETMQGMDLSAVLDPRPVWYSSARALGAVLALILLAILVGPGFRSIARSRLFSPLGGEPWPKNVQIALEGAVPTRIAVGDPVSLRVKLSKGDKASRRVLVRYRNDNQPWQEQMMDRGADGIYAANLDTRLDEGKNQGSMQVQIEAGDDEQSLLPITIVPRLDVTLVQAAVSPPAYVHAAEQARINLAERPAVMAVGSGIELELHFNKPLAQGRDVELVPVNPAVKLPAIQWDRPSSTVAIAHMPATESFRFTVHATDTDYFHNVGAAEYEFIVREDQPPTVQIEEPRRTEDRTPVAEFALKAVAEDDYGVEAAQLVVTRLGSRATTQPAAASAQSKWVIDLVKDNAAFGDAVTWQETGSTLERKRYELGYDWDLATLKDANLKPGDALEFFVQVKDNFNLNGKQHDWVPSGKLRINIISQEQFNTAVQQAFEAVHSQLKELHQNQVRNKAETDALKQLTDKKPALDNADKTQAERLATEQSNAISQAMQEAQKLDALSQKIKENKSTDPSLQQTADSVQKELQQAAEGAMKDAGNNLNEAREQKPDPKTSAADQQKQLEQRNSAMAKASENQQKAADQIRQAMDRLGNFDGLGEFRQKIQEIKAHQERLEQQFNKAAKDELGKKAEELSKDKQDELKKLADEQNGLSKQTQNALEQMNKKAEQMEKADPSSAQAMKQAAQTGNEQQVPGKQNQASQSMQQNQQAQAQQQQKQAEIGLEMIIAKLKEAERRKLEELQAKLAEVQQLVADLIRRQSGHNIDNVLLQGGDKWARMDMADKQNLLDECERDVKSLQDAKTIKDLNTSQRVTEKNTRSTAKKAEELPDPAPAAKLTVAAGHMERAIVHLNEEKLADAYNPPQMEALAALIDSKKAIDEALKKVNDQIKQQSQESLKQAYVKLLDDQKQIGKDVKEIDAKHKDGDLPRPDAIRLGQLPGEQGGLSDRATKLGDELEKLDSIVYVWANKDIVSTMDNVKDDLAKPETGIPTQAEETRIEEQLQAMIDSLAVKPQQKEFEDRNKGGKPGGGQNKVRMPSEAELRLLKALQQAVNNSTVKIDADKDKEKDKDKLLSLGGRQGELRDLLDKMIQKATQGKVKLGPEPDNKDQLPEEAKKEDVEDQEFVNQLLNDKVTDDQTTNSVKLTGDRMARSRQRLALNNDPGKITQEIQKRIQLDLDSLIKLAQAQQAQMKPGQGPPKPGDKSKQPGQPQPGPQQVAKNNQQHQEKGQTPAQQSTFTQGGEPQVDISQDIKEMMKPWGQLHPRDRDAVLEGASEKVNPKYQKMVEDYFKSLSEKAAQQQ